jgi:hypothetical protein
MKTKLENYDSLFLKPGLLKGKMIRVFLSLKLRRQKDTTGILNMALQWPV